MRALWETIQGYFFTTVDQAIEIWGKGGWAMYALALVALVMFSVGMRIWVRTGEVRSRAVSEKTWRRWILHPAQRFGSVGSLLDFAIAHPSDCPKDTAKRFGELRMREILPFDRDLKVMRVCVSAAPLVGLLGTVTGMLATFGALAKGSGGDQTLDQIAKGISEALITTETGLVIALPGLFFQYVLARKLNRYKAFLTHLETVTLQERYKQSSLRSQEAVKVAAREEALRVLRSRLFKRLGKRSPNYTENTRHQTQ